MKEEVAESGDRVTATPCVEAIESLLERFVSWAGENPDIRAVALVGSYAKNTASKNSDIDLIVLTSRPTDYTSREDWVIELGLGKLVESNDWGAITERRLRRPDGLEIEIGIGELAWASADPVDGGTRTVVNDGMRVLHDPDRLLKRLLQSCS